MAATNYNKGISALVPACCVVLAGTGRLGVGVLGRTHRPYVDLISFFSFLFARPPGGGGGGDRNGGGGRAPGESNPSVHAVHPYFIAIYPITHREKNGGQ